VLFYFILLLFSSQVDDGVCDCCDGSDEKAGVCGGFCRELGEKTRLERAKKLEEIREALIVRQR
jgi:protein kinase C substrate 80K-H